MTHGRLSAFGKVQQLAKDANSAVAFAALEAPRNMYSWDETEKAAICPWALELLKDPRPNVATRAAGLLSSCSGAFVDQLLGRRTGAQRRQVQRWRAWPISRLVQRRQLAPTRRQQRQAMRAQP